MASVLSRMEELNRLGKWKIKKYHLSEDGLIILIRSNEADMRSVTSKYSSSSLTGRSSSPSKAVINEDAHSLPRSNSLQPTIEDDENLDLWAVSGRNVFEKYEAV